MVKKEQQGQPVVLAIMSLLRRLSFGQRLFNREPESLFDIPDGIGLDAVPDNLPRLALVNKVQQQRTISEE